MQNNIKKIKQLKYKNQKRGIALVIAITVMTLLLSISLSISNIVLRQIRITNINNASKPAFFVADSAVECAFYFDTKVISDQNSANINNYFNTSVFGLSDKSVPNDKIKCGNGAPLVLSKTTSDDNLVVTTNFDIGYDDMCAKVEVIRNEFDTKITARGYNTGSTNSGCDLSDIDSRRLVERGLTIVY